MTLNLVEQVLDPVARHIETRRDSLAAFHRFQNCGIEGWFKVEVVAALRDRIEGIANHGPDIILRHDAEPVSLELKAATLAAGA